MDFNRDVYCLLGLPFDAVTQQQAVQRLEQAKAAGQRCFMSTPNLNFVVASLDDAAFRASVCRSDLSLADGMPLVWVARLLGVPLPERVSGSGVFDDLRHKSSASWRTYFFGGPEGVAQNACAVLGGEATAMQACGHIYPGFGTVAQMSRQDWIDDINRSNADLLVVSLGSAKGQAWISANLPRLRPLVVSHLGAVINFVAGTVNRAPAWIQRSGLEWLWRIKEEPQLWRRYRKDGLVLLRLLITRVLPLVFFQRLTVVPEADFQRAIVTQSTIKTGVTISLTGAWRHNNLAPVRQAFDGAVKTAQNVTLDFRDATGVDSAFIALLLMLHTALGDLGLAMRIANLSPGLKRFFVLQGVAHLEVV